MQKPSSYPVLTTERLVLRPVAFPEDASGLFEIYSDPEVMTFMPTLPHRDIEETKASMERFSLKEVNWSIFLKPADWMDGIKQEEKRREGGSPRSRCDSLTELVGSVNYHLNSAIPGLGYIIKRSHWGKGFAAEVCRAALKYGFANAESDPPVADGLEAPGLGLQQVELWIDVRNVASEKVALKLGFTRHGSIEQKYDHEVTHHLMFTYGLTRDAFLAMTSQVSTVENKVKNEKGSRDLSNSTTPPPTSPPRIFRAQSVLDVENVQKTAEVYKRVFGCRIDFLWPPPLTTTSEEGSAEVPTHGAVSFGDWTGQGATFQLSQKQTPTTLESTGVGEKSNKTPLSTTQYLFVEARGFDDYFKTVKGLIEKEEAAEQEGGDMSGQLEITSPPEDKPWGMREFSILDAHNGHAFKFGTNT